ncbi:MAG: hypothetical protein ACKV2Q_35020 [Planctomycetaceae bacterium]
MVRVLVDCAHGSQLGSGGLLLVSENLCVAGRWWNFGGLILVRDELVDSVPECI